MKKLLFIALVGASLALPSCNGNANKENDAAMTELTDSVMSIAAEKDSLMQLLTEIGDGMTQIKDMENLLNSTNLSGESSSKKEQIKNDMVLLQQALQERREKLAALEERLKKSNNYSAEMKKSVESMKQQLETQAATINDLTSQLAAANVKIEKLNISVDSLRGENQRVNEGKLAAEQETERVTNDLNTCYYAVGNKSELKKNKVIETGFLRKTKIMQSDFEKNYFIKADKRTLGEVLLNSKKAKVLTNHPAGSYELRDNGGVKTLVIIDPVSFWNRSNYLVVQVD